MLRARREVQSILRTDAINPADGPRRSPEAERFDPPVWKLRWVPERELSWEALLAEARARLGELAPALAGVLWHGGLHVAGRPIDVDAPPTRVAAGDWVALYGFAREPEPIAVDARCILWDADGLLAVDKPVWLSMQRTRASVRSSLEDQLRALLGEPELHAAHRLDRQTSGVALFVRGRERAAELGRAFRDRRVYKRYRACVAPAPVEDQFEVAGWLGRVMHPARFRFGLYAEPGPERRESRTLFRVSERGACGARIEAWPETGRTHQLRVHLAAHGTAIAGDDLYGPAYQPGAPSAAARVLLHAAELGLERGGHTFRVEAPEPADLRAFRAAAPLGDAP